MNRRYAAGDLVRESHIMTIEAGVTSEDGHAARSFPPRFPSNIGLLHAENQLNEFNDYPAT